MSNFMSPVFIIGNPRSGTSLFRLLLTSHSKIVIPPECGFIVWLYKDFKNWSVIDNETKLDIFLEALFGCKKFDTWEIDLGSLKAYIKQRNPKKYSELCESIYVYYSLKFHKDITVWGDKNNFHIDYLNELLEIHPQAKFIHLVRDGRDVFCSYLDVMKNEVKSPYAPRLSTDINSVASEWNSNLIKVEKFFTSQPDINTKTVRYEDLIATPKALLEDVFSWCGLDYEESVLEFFNHNISLKLEPEKTLEWKAKTKEPIDPDNSGKFRSILSTDEIEQFNNTAQESLTRYGYE